MQINRMRLLNADSSVLSVAASLAIVAAAVVVLSMLTLHGTRAAMRYLPPEALELTTAQADFM